MKKLITTICMVSIVATISAQNNDCKYEKNELDKFTHKKIVLTKWEYLTTLLGNMKEYVPSVRCLKEDTLKQLILNIDGNYFTSFKPTKEEIDSAIVVPIGSKAVFLMEDQKSVELTITKNLNSNGDYTSPYTGDNKSEKFRVHWNIDIYYPLDNNAIKAFTSQGATAIRVFFKNNKYTDYNIHKKKYGAIQHLMNCISQAE